MPVRSDVVSHLKNACRSVWTPFRIGAFIRKHDLAWHISFSPVAAMVLLDNAMEDVVNRAWFESAISNVFPKQEFESAISNAFPKQEAH